MRVVGLSLFVLFSSFSSCTPNGSHDSKALAKKDSCTIFANGYEVVDDAPAINSAITSCGNGGTITLPEGQNYSIRTPLNFQDCKSCELQIEGLLVVSTSAVSYKNTFNLAGVNGATIRSVSGKGMIDGNAYSYWLSRWDSGMVQVDTFFELAHSSNIIIDNFSVKDVKQRFFRALNASNLSFSRLNLDIYGQWGEYPRNAVEVAGIEIGNSTNVTISSINMTFRPRQGHNGPLGFCIPFDSGSTNISVKDISCRGAIGGVVINLGTIRPYIPYNPVKNVLIQNLFFDGGVPIYHSSYVPTGFLNEWLGTLVPISDVTWDNVTVLNTSQAIVVHNCYQKIRGMTGYPAYCAQVVRSNITNAWFKNYRGSISVKPPTDLATGWNNMSYIDLHFENWGARNLED
jgi:hypothetical protein